MNEKYAIKWSSRFKKDYKRMMRQGKNISKLDARVHIVTSWSSLY